MSDDGGETSSAILSAYNYHCLNELSNGTADADDADGHLQPFSDYDVPDDEIL